MPDLKELGTPETILGITALLGMGILAMKKLLNMFGLDVVKKNGNDAKVCFAHESIVGALEQGNRRFLEIDRKLDEMPGKIIGLLKDTKGLL